MWHAFLRDANFKKCDAFIGFQKDTPAAVIFQATNKYKSFLDAGKDGSDEGRCADIINYCNQFENLIDKTPTPNTWKIWVSINRLFPISERANCK